MKKTYRWGIMGAGIIAKKMADALRQSPHAELVFIASKDRERAKAFAREQEIPGYGSYDELVNNKSVDIIYVATTHNFHHGNARLALEHGKHVVIEKAFTVNAREADDLAALAKSRGLFLMEAIWTRFLPADIKMKSLIEDGRIGDLQYLDISFGGFVLPMYESRLKDPALAGGVTLDMGIYPISFCCYMLGQRPREIKSMCRFSDREVDDLAAYQFRFPSGAIAQIGTSFMLKMENRAALYGTKGYILFPQFPSGNSFTIYTHDGGNEILNEETISLDHWENGFLYEVEEVHRCLDSGKTESPLITLSESREIMAVMDSMRAEWGLTYEFER